MCHKMITDSQILVTFAHDEHFSFPELAHRHSRESQAANPTKSSDAEKPSRPPQDA